MNIYLLEQANDELIDIQEVVMIYSPTDAERKITEKSAVQPKLWEIFRIGKNRKAVVTTQITS